MSERDVKPARIYHGKYDESGPIKLRIATGGSGQSGLLQALADAFIDKQVGELEKKEGVKKSNQFRIAWLTSDTTGSIEHLARHEADVGITYHPLVEEEALEEKIVDRRVYAWRDHWMLVGPKTNVAGLTSDNNATIFKLFTQLYRKAVETQTNEPEKRVRFLSRYDKSATNIKESSIWATIGQTPWSFPYSDWYHRNVDFPFRTLEVAALLGEYTLTDRGTWLSVKSSIRDKLTVYMEGHDSNNENDKVMLNPAHALVQTNHKMATDFVDWLIEDNGGQAIIEAFTVKTDKAKNKLYTRAPK